MTVAIMATGNKDRVGLCLKGREDMKNVDPAGARDQDNADIRGILQPQRPGQVGSGLGAPLAAEGQDIGIIVHNHTASFHDGGKVGFDPVNSAPVI